MLCEILLTQTDEETRHGRAEKVTCFISKGINSEKSGITDRPVESSLSISRPNPSGTGETNALRRQSNVCRSPTRSNHHLFHDPFAPFGNGGGCSDATRRHRLTLTPNAALRASSLKRVPTYLNRA